jgi:16S rRNA (adenine1518-N6/adenine1519-N6)-dimethyltransferase
MTAHGKRRAFGQHFLKDTALIQQIIDEVAVQAERHGCHHVLEVGPGPGALTLPLIRRFSTPENTSQPQLQIQSFQLIEKDRKLAERWSHPETPLPFSFSVECGDFLDIPPAHWLKSDGSPLLVVSNLPYASGTAILTALARQKPSIPVLVLMFQAEVAQRLRAAPSTPDRGSLSLWIQNEWDVTCLLKVPPQAFSPPPEVQSEVVVLTRREQPRIPEACASPEAARVWEVFLKTCFAHRRKMLRSSLPWPNLLTLAEVDGTKRPEALDWDEWTRLFRAALPSLLAPPKRSR